jgi:hypothetical protein
MGGIVGSVLIGQVGKEKPYFCLLHLLFSADRFKRNVIRITLLTKDKFLFDRSVVEVSIFLIIHNSRYLDPAEDFVKF